MLLPTYYSRSYNKHSTKDSFRPKKAKIVGQKQYGEEQKLPKSGPIYPYFFLPPPHLPKYDVGGGYMGMERNLLPAVRKPPISSAPPPPLDPPTFCCMPISRRFYSSHLKVPFFCFPGVVLRASLFFNGRFNGRKFYWAKEPRNCRLRRRRRTDARAFCPQGTTCEQAIKMERGGGGRLFRSL